MNIRSMSVFCKVVDKSVMAHAAQELQMTPAAVSKIIGELEEKLGVRLLQRTTRRLQLTEAGTRYYHACVKILQEIDDVHQQFSQLSTEVQGRLRITAPMSYGLTMLANAIRDFKMLHPNVEISLQLEDAAVNLIEEGFDLAIRIQRKMKDSSLVANLFGEFKHYLVCSRAYKDEMGSIRTPEDLGNHRCLAYTNSMHRNRWIFHRNDKSFTHHFQPHIEANSSLFLSELMRQGQGVCLLPSFLIEEAVKRKEVVHLLPQYALESGKGWIVYPSRKFQPPAVTRFVEFFCKRQKIHS
ncbi:MAG TPA: LysR family transcriptional regulator [Oligoflexus sp.]|uniref:LysR family transcriptional regulator n=1 Tax=Oligoflexus sp. TaxID=1971216 RepID=UPI002D291597|nr:LysR family transcriptional regulator [Oligoflexus sp.]HYX38893.1 LysR family transcriptional regulator [Oligoflexus sp.]